MQWVAVFALTVLGFGNLILPAFVQNALPVDYIVLALVVLMLCVLFHVHSLVRNFTNVGTVVFFGFSLLPGMLVAPLNPYGELKVQGIFIALLLLLVPLALRSPSKAIRQLLRLIFGVALVLSLVIPVFGGWAENGRYTLWGLSPIGTARMASLLALVSICYFLDRSGRMPQRVLLLACASLGVFATVFTGSRGPLLSLTLAVVAVLLTALFRRKANGWAVAALSTVAATVFMVISQSSVVGADRVLTGDDSGRFSIYLETIEVAVASPSGVGWGNLAAYLPALPTTDGYSLHPHNIFLEVAVEGGLIALVGLLALVLVATRSVISAAAKNVAVAPAVLALLVFALANAQFSSDVIGNRMLWLVIGLALALRGGSVQSPTPSLRSGAATRRASS